MVGVFPEPIERLPEANIPIKGVKAYLSQAENHQIIFMEFSEDVDLPEHEHESQWGFMKFLIRRMKRRDEKSWYYRRVGSGLDD